MRTLDDIQAYVEDDGVEPTIDVNFDINLNGDIGVDMDINGCNQVGFNIEVHYGGDIDMNVACDRLTNRSIHQSIN